jgi:3-hydroxymyristoyl/3-hydroxydecanoyl-(acyl carrier protein) dehydratase
MNRVSAATLLAAAEPLFAGHFPGHPILPGVMLLGLAQRAIAASLQRPVKLVRVVRQRFVAPVLPDNEVTVNCVLTDNGDGTLRAACRWCLSDGTLAARGELVVG